MVCANCIHAYFVVFFPYYKPNSYLLPPAVHNQTVNSNVLINYYILPFFPHKVKNPFIFPVFRLKKQSALFYLQSALCFL